MAIWLRERLSWVFVGLECQCVGASMEENHNDTSVRDALEGPHHEFDVDSS